jgi:hypothetical protein
MRANPKTVVTGLLFGNENRVNPASRSCERGKPFFVSKARNSANRSRWQSPPGLAARSACGSPRRGGPGTRAARRVTSYSRCVQRAANLRLHTALGGHHETPPPQILASGSGRCRAPGRVAHREGANLPPAILASGVWGETRRIRISDRRSQSLIRSPFLRYSMSEVLLTWMISREDA